MRAERLLAGKFSTYATRAAAARRKGRQQFARLPLCEQQTWADKKSTMPSRDRGGKFAAATEGVSPNACVEPSEPVNPDNLRFPELVKKGGWRNARLRKSRVALINVVGGD